jgi:hypothetical protein
MDQNHPTEAACLLERGTSYRRRTGLMRPGTATDPIFAGFKHAAFSLYFGDAPIYHFDLEGRWQRAFINGTHFLKGLDAGIQGLDRVRAGQNLTLIRRTLSEAEARDIDHGVRATVVDLLSDLDSGRLPQKDPPIDKAAPLAKEELRGFLERIIAWDSTAWHAHRERYCATYGPLPFLPPECVSAVVLQATLGHKSARTFGLGTAAEPGVRSRVEFEAHTRAVSELWGRRLLQTRTLFLAGSDVMHQPFEHVAFYLDAVLRVFPIRPASARAEGSRADLDEGTPRFDGVHAFLDNFDARVPKPAEWRELAALGLMRMSLGVESGDPEVRAVYRKKWSEDDLRNTVAAIKSAGLGISVLTLVGAGGADRAPPHVLGTRRLIDSLDLGTGDFVFLLDENEIHDPSLVPSGMTALHGRAWLEQQAALRDALSPLKSRGIKVLPYTLDKQWA